jgi:uncharacterized protein
MLDAPDKLSRLREIVRETGSALVAFSGGVDSALVLRVAVDELGERALAVTGDSPAVPRRDLEDAQRLARELGARHRVLRTEELGEPRYVANGPDRCYWCKSELFGKLEVVRQEEALACVLDGTNLDDRGDFRPGLAARRERGVRSPLCEAEMTKEDVRAASRALGLSTAEKPAEACLASRIPYGTEVTAERLERVGRAEERIKQLGFRQVRVRHHGDVARIEVDPGEMGRLLDPAVRSRLVRGVREAGYRYVALDLDGYRTGSLNEVLPARIARVDGSSRGG